jgi:hypothetical protein
MANDPTLAQYLCHRWSDLKNERASWDSLWQDIADYVMPRKAEISSRQSSPGTQRHDVLFDTTAIFANQTLANGQLSYMTPAESRWFTFDAPPHLEGEDKVKDWFQRCSEISQRNLANSNFYSEIHELYFDDGGFGTSNLFALPGRNSPLTFQSLSIGSYCLAEDDEGIVDTCFREIMLTCRQAAMKFGEENLSEKMRKQLEEYRTKGTGEGVKHSFLHAIYPRAEGERSPGKLDGPNKPFASVYVDVANKHVVSVGGYDEKPFFATRHLKWGDCVYGYSPSWMALPEARQINFLTKQLDALAEVKAFPRFLVPDTHEGEIDLRAGGPTYFDPNMPNAVPREWLTSGDYNIGLDREKRKQAAIERAYYVDLFNMFASLDKQMTAREVAERSAEKLIQFTPAFARKTTELFTPLLRRVFGMQLRAGLFPPPPRELMQADARGGLAIPEPEVTYTSRVALAIKALQNAAFARTMEIISPIVPMKPEILDNFDFDRISRDGARNDGLPADWMVAKEKVDEVRQARAEAQAQAAQMQQAQAMADAAGKVGNIKPDSMVAQALGGMQG